jgi:HAD superfamily hydrolase (TIGR01509 family)
MIKLILFDLDGVLVDAKKIHYETLNSALCIVGEQYKISWDEHLNKYDGLKTNEKLDILTKSKELPLDKHKLIWEQKQKLTLEKLEKLPSNKNLIETINELYLDGYKIGCCSNSIRKTILTVLSKLNIIEYFDIILSNEDVKNSKPHPEIYWKAISELSMLPEETLIIEDSPHGLQAAYRSKSHVLRVLNNSEVNYLNITKNIIELNRSIYKYRSMPKWNDKKLNVLIPMAGAGSRFEKAGYTFPKPLIEVNGKPMIQLVVENINIDANYIYIVQKKHREKYNLDGLLNLITPNCNIIEVDGITEGAACTALLARDLINTNNPLFFANSDQYVDWNSNDFMYKMQETNVDGGILTFKSTHPKWSFVKVDENGFISEVAEKNPISNTATVGFYYWKNGSDFVKYADKMIEENIRVNNEFYVCPVFNQAINDGKKIIPFNIEEMWGLGTPEDLNNYLESYGK